MHKASALELADALHPSAAVGGTPTLKALELISELEGMERGHYAGPVGWIDASGDGEFGITLRSAALDGNRVRLFAGAGVVADSGLEAELAETATKLVPRGAFNVRFRTRNSAHHQPIKAVRRP